MSATDGTSPPSYIQLSAAGRVVGWLLWSLGTAVLVTPAFHVGAVFESPRTIGLVVWVFVAAPLLLLLLPSEPLSAHARRALSTSVGVLVAAALYLAVTVAAYSEWLAIAADFALGALLFAALSLAFLFLLRRAATLPPGMRLLTAAGAGLAAYGVLAWSVAAGVGYETPVEAWLFWPEEIADLAR